MRVVGLDIGGANLKGCGLTFDEEGNTRDLTFSSHFFPVWQEGLDNLWPLIDETVQQESQNKKPDLISVVLTAELSDFFHTKREGVQTISTNIIEMFGEDCVVFPSVDLELLHYEEVMTSPLSVAAANWSVLAWVVGRNDPECILVDIGSTTTDIIPVRNGLPQTHGTDDTNRLIHGELVYTGALRTNLSTIIRNAIIKGKVSRVSSEYFATSGDVHLVLGHITKDQYVCETADGRGKSKPECMARIARVVCGDIETVSENEILDIARQAWAQQVNDIKDGLLQVCQEHGLKLEEETLVFSGLGSDFLGRTAIISGNVGKAVDLKKTLGYDGSISATAYAAGLFAGQKRGGWS